MMTAQKPLTIITPARSLIPSNPFVAFRWRDNFARTFLNALAGIDAASVRNRRSLAEFFNARLLGEFDSKPLDASESMASILDSSPLAETLAYMAYRDAQGLRVKDDTPAKTRALLAVLLRWTDALDEATRWGRSTGDVAPRVRASLTGKGYRPALMWNYWAEPAGRIRARANALHRRA